MTQTINGSVLGLFSAARTVYAAGTASDLSPVYVCLGHPGSYQPNDIVAIATAVRQPVERPTLGTNRSREKLVEIDNVVSVFVPGNVLDDTTPSGTQVDALTRCNVLSDQLETYFRAAGQETLGGGCMDSWVSAIDGPTMAESVNSDGVPIGRVAELVVTVTARIRY